MIILLVQVGVSPLLMAVKQGHINIVKTLLSDVRTNLNLQEKVGHLCAEVCRSGNGQCVIFSLQKVQYSAIFFAVHCKQNDMLDLFMGNHGLDLTVRDIVSYNY